MTNRSAPKSSAARRTRSPPDSRDAGICGTGTPHTAPHGVASTNASRWPRLCWQRRLKATRPQGSQPSGAFDGLVFPARDQYAPRRLDAARPDTGVDLVPFREPIGGASREGRRELKHEARLACGTGAAKEHDAARWQPLVDEPLALRHGLRRVEVEEVERIGSIGAPLRQPSRSPASASWMMPLNVGVTRVGAAHHGARHSDDASQSSEPRHDARVVRREWKAVGTAFISSAR